MLKRSIALKGSKFYFYLYDLPLGVYTASARLIGPDSVAGPLHLRMRVFGTPVTSGDSPQDSVPVWWPFDAKGGLLGRPVLYVTP